MGRELEHARTMLDFRLYGPWSDTSWLVMSPSSCEAKWIRVTLGCLKGLLKECLILPRSGLTERSVA